MPCISAVFRDASDKESVKETFQAALAPPRASRNPPGNLGSPLQQHLFTVINSIFDLFPSIDCINLSGGIDAPER